MDPAVIIGAVITGIAIIAAPLLVQRHRRAQKRKSTGPDLTSGYPLAFFDSYPVVAGKEGLRIDQQRLVAAIDKLLNESHPRAAADLAYLVDSNHEALEEAGPEVKAAYGRSVHSSG
jgi:hypothetical protein